MLIRSKYLPKCKTVIVLMVWFLIGQARAAPWCSADVMADKTMQALRRDVDLHRAEQPRAAVRLHTEGTLPHQGIWDQSVEAKKDFSLMRDLALLWRASHDQASLDRLTLLLDAWASTYQPSYNPIDETDFDALLDAFAITQSALPPANREKTAVFVRALGSGYLKRMQLKQNPRKGTWINNWQSHRIKLATLAAVALGDNSLFDAARTQFRQQLKQNLRADGSTIDFEERDALHYTVYDLEPLVRAAMAARLRQEDWLNLRADNGATLAMSLNWLLPYAKGEKTHDEFLHTTVKFDLTRRDAGIRGYSGPWDTKNSAQLFWLASTLDARYAQAAQGLASAPAWMAACWQLAP